MVQKQQLSRGWTAVSLVNIPVAKHRAVDRGWEEKMTLGFLRMAYSKVSLKSLGWWPLGQGLTAPTCLEGVGLPHSAPGQGLYVLNGQLP